MTIDGKEYYDASSVVAEQITQIITTLREQLAAVTQQIEKLTQHKAALVTALRQIEEMEAGCISVERGDHQRIAREVLEEIRR